VALTPIPAAAPGLSSPPPLLLAAGLEVNEVKVLVPVDIGI
jgi:hypothetical protein